MLTSGISDFIQSQKAGTYEVWRKMALLKLWFLVAMQG